MAPSGRSKAGQLPEHRVDSVEVVINVQSRTTRDWISNDEGMEADVSLKLA